MDRFRIFSRLRKSTPAPEERRRETTRVDNVAPGELEDNTRPSTHISRSSGNRNSHQGTLRVPRHSTQISSVSSYHGHDYNASVVSAVSGVRDKRRSVDVVTQKLTAYLQESPLALTLAQAYLKQTGMRCDDYLKLHSDKAEAMRNQHKRSSRTSLDYKALVLAPTLEMTMQEIDVQHQDAALLLDILAFFDPKHICYEVLNANTSMPPNVIRHIVSSRVVFEAALEVLQKWGIVEKHNWYYHIQPPIHAWTLRNCVKSTQSIVFSRYAARCVIDAFDNTNRFNSWYQCLPAHAEHLTSPKVFEYWLSHADKQETLDCIEGLTRVLTAFNRDQRAKHMYQKILEYQRHHLGQNHPSTCKTMWQLGKQHIDRKEYQKADSMLNHALVGFEQTPGMDEYVIWTLIDLARMHRHRRIWAESEKMLRHARHGLFTIAERYRNPHQALEINVELGRLYREQGQLDGAERMLRLATTYADEKFGGSSRCKVELGSIHLEQQKYPYARVILEGALTDHERGYWLEEQDKQTLVMNLSYIL